MRYAAIQENDFINGEGVCVSFWTQGCPHRCPGCHNPETWTAENSMEITPEEVLKKYKKYANYYGDNGGVTFSGGEPLLQSEFVLETIKLLKQEGIHTAIDTAGVAENYDEILKLVKLKHPLKAPKPILVAPFPIVTLFKLVHS